MADGDLDRFETFVTAQGPRLLKLAYLLTGSVTDAEDVLQDSLARLFVAWTQVERSADVHAYARRVVVNTNQRRFRRRRVSEVLDGREHHRGTGCPDFAVIEDRIHLADALGALPSRQRVVIVLRYFEDMSERDIASLLGCSPGTVKSQASKALTKLRNHPSLNPLLVPRPHGVTNA